MPCVLSSCRNLALQPRRLQPASAQASSLLLPHQVSSLSPQRHLRELLRVHPSAQQRYTGGRSPRILRVQALQSLLKRFTSQDTTTEEKYMARKFIVGGNHKANGTTESVKKLVELLNAATVPGENEVEVVISPPFVYLPLVKSLLRKDFFVAAQNCWVGKGGAYTGEVTAEMLVNLDIPWVILGHSERRTIIKESNEFVADKVAYALGQGLKVIACIGESLEQREAGETISVVAAQLQAIKDKISSWENVVLAYEPIWAIGTGKVATPEQAQETHSEIRKWLAENVSADVAAATRIQYGGSVNAANCKTLAGLPDVDGFLVGGASLKAEFVDIINSATVSKTA